MRIGLEILGRNGKARFSCQFDDRIKRGKVLKLSSQARAAFKRSYEITESLSAHRDQPCSAWIST